MTPVSIWVGLAKVGGYFAFLNIAVIGLQILHRSVMNKELKSYLKQHHKSYKLGQKRKSRSSKAIMESMLVSENIKEGSSDSDEDIA